MLNKLGLHGMVRPSPTRAFTSPCPLSLPHYP